MSNDFNKILDLKSINFSSENNAIVVCHSQLIEDFMDKYKFNYNSNMLRNFKKRN